MDAILCYLNVARVMNALLDAGGATSIAATKEHIYDRTLFDWLDMQFPVQKPALALSSYWTLNREEVLERFGDLARVNTESNGGYDVTNNGLAMVVAFCIEAVQALWPR